MAKPTNQLILHALTSILLEILNWFQMKVFRVLKVIMPQMEHKSVDPF